MARDRLLAGALAAGMTIGCSTSPRTLSFLPPAGDIQRIEIDDVVRGPDAAATLFPMEAHYGLTADGESFVGRGAFSIGSKQPRRAEVEVRVPRAAVERFVAAVSTALIREGYTPQRPPPGGAFPDVRIVFVPRDSPPAALFTRSPGAQYLPWAVEFEGRTYTIESTAPAQAFSELRNHLKREELDRLAQAAVGPVQ